MDVEWHAQHRLCRKASLEDRVRWHLAHRDACGCRRDLPESVVAKLRRREQAAGR